MRSSPGNSPGCPWSCSACSASPWPRRDPAGTQHHQRLIVLPCRNSLPQQPSPAEPRCGNVICSVFINKGAALGVPETPLGEQQGRQRLLSSFFVGCSLCWMTLQAQLGWDNITALCPSLTGILILLPAQLCTPRDIWGRSLLRLPSSARPQRSQR